ncbi:plexin repeat domain containing protein [Acanthamoeba castellanii str. Neff]|uniref:Plexin repeat domain containing protein n=1 Tax=Acanthamoeba castellanii (strain ATCC 30010 / Neff) TaxID=1257118 RepID=L8GU69_ACACF|nr:plexin repeat domain containing protein [Acanthamoeba castellanii str. Neff]ELR15636.1 plexin repeat domain containing protein [Acanthamoeba castellanii str. Neff]
MKMSGRGAATGLPLLLLLMATCSVVLAWSDNCGQFGNCTTCTGKGGCGWCLQPTGNSLLNGSCVPGEDSGPTNFLTCSRWFYQDCHNLTECEAATCGDCADLSGCGWCASSKFCLPGNSTGPNEDHLAVCAKPYWIWGKANCPLEPTVTPSQSPSHSPSASASPSISPSASASPSASPSSSPSATPSPSASPDLCPTLGTNCTTCVAGAQCLWCPTSKACFNSTRSPGQCQGEATNECYDEYCANFTKCADCTKQTVCGWCNYTKCVAGSHLRPDRGSCLAYQYGSCAAIPCPQFADCAACTQPGNTHCAWCDPSLKCLPIANPPPKPGDAECPSNWFYGECPAPVDCGMHRFQLPLLLVHRERNGLLLLIFPRRGGDDSLGGGAIAGIVIGSVCAAGIIPAAGFLWYRFYYSRRHYYATLA